MVKTKEDLTGKVFGRLTVISQAEDRVQPDGRHVAMWNCECGCEKHTKLIVNGTNLATGHTQSCGCYQREKNSITHKKYNKYDLSGEYGIGYTLSTNEPFYFDLEDYDKIKDYCWRESGEDGYIITQSSGKTIYMHVFIMEPVPEGKEVDHRYGHKNDMRKSQLRYATHSENNKNKPVRKDNTSGITGLSYVKRDDLWVAYIKNEGVTYRKTFKNKEDAIKWRKQKEEELFGEFIFKEEKEKEDYEI